VEQSTADLEKAASVNPTTRPWTNLAINYQARRNFLRRGQLSTEVCCRAEFLHESMLRARLDIDWKGDTGPMERLLTETKVG